MGRPLECDYYSRSARFTAVTYILGILWVVLFVCLCTAFIRNYNALAVHLRGNAGNTCCCGPAPSAVIGGNGNGNGGGMPTTFIIAPAGPGNYGGGITGPQQFVVGSTPAAQFGITGPTTTAVRSPQHGAAYHQAGATSVGGQSSASSGLEMAVISPGPGTAVTAANGGTVVVIAGNQHQQQVQQVRQQPANVI